MNLLDPIFQSAVNAKATDIHICENQRPRIRIDNDLIPMKVDAVFSAADIVGFIFEKLSAPQKMAVSAKIEHGLDADCSFDLSAKARVRANIYITSNGTAFAFRIIPKNRLSAEQVGIPFAALSVCKAKNGLFIVTGANGSGKTTTMAAMIDIINATRKVHILSIEDPIEYVFENREALISQREIPTHAPTFYSALRSAVRENPDIVFLGEMRDLETTRTALELAETGHLVFATLHTRTSSSTIDRLIGQFPAAEQPQIRLMISDSLIGILSQTLLVKKVGGLIAAFEFLKCTPAVRNMIREQKIPQIYSAMQTGQSIGMTTMEDSLTRLVANSVVTPQEAVSKSHSPSQMLAKLLESPLISKADLKDLS